MAITAAVFCGALVGCGNEGDQKASGGGRAHVQGSLTVDQRIALPANAMATVALVKIGDAGKIEGEPVTSNTMRDPGQPPIAFMLTFPASAVNAGSKYALKAGIQDGQGRLHWATRAPVPVKPLDNGKPIQLALRPAGKATGRSVHYVCSGFAADVTAGKDKAVIHWQDHKLELPSVVSASGAKYANDTATFWGKGQDQAYIEVNGRKYDSCLVTSRLTQIGPHLRAIGSNPDWTLRIRGDQDPSQVELVTSDAHKQAVHSFTDVQVAQPADKSQWRRVYGAAAGDASLSVMVAKKACVQQDGEGSLPLTVTVLLQGRVYHGCGERIP